MLQSNTGGGGGELLLRKFSYIHTNLSDTDPILFISSLRFTTSYTLPFSGPFFT